MEPSDPYSRENTNRFSTCDLKGFRTKNHEIKIGKYNELETRIKLLIDPTNTEYEVGERLLTPMDMYTTIEWHNKTKLFGKIDPSYSSLDIEAISSIERGATKFYKKNFMTKEERKKTVAKEQSRKI